jgi:hypothetical protein
MYRIGLILGPVMFAGAVLEWVLTITHYAELLEKSLPWTQHMTSPTGIWITIVVGIVIFVAALAERRREKGEEKRHLTSPPQNTAPPTPPPNIFAPNGIAIGGGAVTNPTVNNYGPPQRQLTTDEREKFISYLRPFCPFEVVVRPIPGNAESMEYADQIVKAITEAGCTLGRTPFLIDTGVSYGIEIAIHDIKDIPLGANVLAGAFNAAGIKFRSVAGVVVPPNAVYVAVNLNDTRPR